MKAEAPAQESSAGYGNHGDAAAPAAAQQHPVGDNRAVAEETAHTLWISHQVLDETALLRGAEEQDLSVEGVAETP